MVPSLLSLRVAIVSAILVTITALPLARLMDKKHFTGRDLVEAFITLPLVLPPSVVEYGLLVLIGVHVLIGQFLNKFGYSLVFTWVAVTIAATVVAFPLMYQSARGAFASVNPNLEKAARTLGAGELRILFTITLPLAWPDVMSGLALAFARALGEFGRMMNHRHTYLAGNTFYN